MTIVAEHYAHVVGVDTHAATHQYAVIAAGTGAVLDQAQFPTTAAGLARALDWIGRRTSGDLEGTLVSAEGTGSYGARLAVLLLEAGYRVVDAPSPKRARGSAKNDKIDAVIAARNSLAKDIDKLADARGGQTQATLQILLTARDSMTRERTRMINALNALVRTSNLGIDARRKLGRPAIRTIGNWRPRQEPIATATARGEAIRLARRIHELDIEINTNLKTLRQVITAAVPVLLDLPGIGPVNAAIVLTAWSHHGRVRDEAAFAKLGGVCPLEVSSGKSTEYRLNRTGDRQLNRALHAIANNRMIHDPETRAYLDKRTRQGLSKPRIRRCLKRYIARDLYRLLTTQVTTINEHQQAA